MIKVGFLPPLYMIKKLRWGLMVVAGGKGRFAKALWVVMNGS